MRRLPKAWLVLLLATTPAAAEPALPYWHLWTGADGTSHLTKCAMTGFTQPGAGKQWLREEPGSRNLAFAVDPKGDWHENPVVQWVSVVQGAFYLRAQDGAEAILMPGDLLLGEDLGTKPDADGHRGHVSASRGDRPVALMFAQTADKPVVGQPCHAK